MEANIKENNIKILLSGGGTGGSVTSLLAIAEKAREEKKHWSFVFVGTKYGPEQGMVQDCAVEMKFRTMVSGKFRRYLSFKNFVDLFKIVAAFFQSFIILHQEKPDLILSAGSFVSVPFIWAAGLKKIPVIIHQQDVRPGLANKLMSLAADVITVTFAKSLADYGPKAIWIGNPTKSLPIDEYKKSVNRIWNKYGLKTGKPLILVTGGRMGARSLNSIVIGSQNKLKDYQVVHLTGVNKADKIIEKGENYHVFESLVHEDFLILMISASLVITRAGLGSLTELSELSKASIIIPLPDSHQKNNAEVFSRMDAALVLDQKKLTSDKLASEIDSLLTNEARLKLYSKNISQVIRKGASLKALSLIDELLEAKSNK